MKKVVVITGPTAVGKTDLSIRLAKRFNTEIINADASQFRRDLNIGTAKITKKDMDGVTHHLIDILDASDEFSIKDYQVKGRELIEKIDMPFIVGGSGLYINALVTDYNLESSSRDKSRFKDYSNEDLYNWLLELDSQAAQKIHPNNRRRVERYIELALEQGEVKVTPPVELYDTLTICLMREREILYDRINKRCDIMFDAGWVDEAIDLRNKGILLNNIKDIGYSDIGKYLDNLITLDEVKETIKQKTRHYAKRQITWFKNKMNCVFYDLDNDNEESLIEMIKDFLKK